MAAKVPIRLSIIEILRLVFLAIFYPSRFQEEEAADCKTLETRPNADLIRVNIVRSSYFESFIFVLTAVVVGWFTAKISQFMWVQNRPFAIGLAIVGTAILLWATVAVKGWEVASFSTVTLGERLNICVFRFLYWLGTMLLIAAIFLG